jgi:hypothetical protein
MPMSWSPSWDKSVGTHSHTCYPIPTANLIITATLEAVAMQLLWPRLGGALDMCFQLPTSQRSCPPALLQIHPELLMAEGARMETVLV